MELAQIETRPKDCQSSQFDEANDFLQTSHREVVSTWAIITQKLTSLENLPDDWDGDGGEAIQPLIIKRSREFLLLLRATNKNCPRSVRATPDGVVVFEWADGVAKIEAEISLDFLEWMEWLPGKPVNYRRVAWPE